MKKYLFAASCILLLATACKKEPDYKDPLAGGKDKEEIAVKQIEVTSGSACFAWSISDWKTPESDFNSKYDFGVYSDATCETPVIGWRDTTLSRQTSTSYQDVLLDVPAFTFTGLESNTDYWFYVKDGSGILAPKKVKFHTPASKNISISSTEAEAGTIILFEDFSECLYGGDHINKALGYKVNVPSTTTDPVAFFKAEGINPDGILFANPALDAPLFVFGQRIMNWAQNEDDKIHSQAGYLKIGKSKGTRGQIFTPVLSSLKQGKLAKVEVSFRGCPYSAKCEATSNFNERYVDICVSNGGTFNENGNILLAPEYSDSARVVMDNATIWKTYTATIDNVKPTSRISIGGGVGPDSHTNGYARFFIDDVQVKVLEYKDEPLPEAELKADKVFWSNAVLSWVNPVDVTITGYQLYIDNVKKADIAAGETSYNLKGLTKGTKYTAKLVGATAGADQNFNEVEFTTGNISQVRKNVGPTSISVAFDNRAGNINSDGCFHVQLFESNDTTSTPVYSDYVLDAQNLSLGTPFLTSRAAGSSTTIAPTAVAFGYLKPDTHYWFRVKCVKTYAYDSYATHKTSNPTHTAISSGKGNSEYSELVEVYTEPEHSPVTNEVFYMGFDKVTLLADFVNLAAGTYPSCYANNTAHTALTTSQFASWNKGWRFYPLRTQLTSSQFANHNAWHSGGLKPDTNKVVNTTSGSATTSLPSFANGATIYNFKPKEMEVLNLKDWYISNNVWPNQGCLALGVAYNSADNELGTNDKKLGFIATPALETNLPAQDSVLCTVSFKALALQGVAMQMSVGVWNASETKRTGSPVWEQTTVKDLKNSTGEITASTSFTITEKHDWYDYSVDVYLGKGDRIGFATDKKGTAVIDDILIVKK